MKAVLASGNAGKLKELGELLEARGLTLISQGALGIDAAEETGCTFIENALLKARHASALSGLPAIADDSGIAVDALGGAPGVHSARFAGPDADDEKNNRKLLLELKARSALVEGRDPAPGQSTAHYHCVIVMLRHAEDPTPLIASGRLDGQITSQPRGTNGFGYDPYFYLPAQGVTAAELAPAQKNRISHRGQAVTDLLRQLPQ